MTTTYHSRLHWKNSKGEQHESPKDLNDKELMAELVYWLNRKEESDSGRVFRPNTISSVRVMDGSILSQILIEMEGRISVPSD